MVDWSLARRVARLAGGSEPAQGLDVDIGLLATAVEPDVARYTGLQLAAPAPAAESVGREEWAAANLSTLASLLDPLAERAGERLESAGFLAGALRAGCGAMLAAEAGLVVGYMSQRVLGQYELALLQPEAPTRLLFVAPNLAKAIRELQLDRTSFLTWVALHELTHVFQFSGVPWLRDHLGGLVHEYLATVQITMQGGAAGGIAHLRDPAALVEVLREGGLVALVHTGDQRRLIQQVQAVMAVIEGYSEHVMDAVGRQVVPAYEGLRAAMERRRRNRSAPERLLQRLLGFELKLRQYEFGKRFCDAVVDEGGIESLNRVWAAPEALPTLAELRDPGAWSTRLERERWGVS